MPHYNVLFLCTGNSARSILAEAILNSKGAPTFTAYSAGSHPSGAVRPEALRQIASAGIPVEGLRSKSWDEFAQPGAPHLDFVFTVCDNAANEVCPIWPGLSGSPSGLDRSPDTRPAISLRNAGVIDLQKAMEEGEPLHPITAHWGVPDPAAVRGTPQEIDRAFAQTFSTLDRRITLLLSLPLASLDSLAIQQRLDSIAHQ